MGMSINPSVIIGVNADKILEYEEKIEKFELHDERTGKPTGKFRTDRVNYVSFGNKSLEYNGSVSSWEICEELLSDLEDSPNIREFGLHTLNYGNNTMVFGIKVLTADGNYGEIDETSLERLEIEKGEVVEILKQHYNYTGPVSVYLDSGVSV
jgi:hypothetical protein